MFRKTILILFLGISYSCFSQTANEINKRVDYELFAKRFPDFTHLKDSVAAYTFAISLHAVKDMENVRIDSIVVNDSVAYKFYKDFEFLKDINYADLLKARKRAIIVIPVAIIIVHIKNPTSNPPTIKVEHSLMKSFNNLFIRNYSIKNQQFADFIYLDLVGRECTTKTYD